MPYVKSHPRRGTKGVKSHIRNTKKRKVPSRNHEYTQEGRYGEGYYRGYQFSPDIDEEGDINGYWIEKEGTHNPLKFVSSIREGINFVDTKLK